jgi:hypothetical protein
MTSYSSVDGTAIVVGELREVESLLFWDVIRTPSAERTKIERLTDRMLILMLQWRQEIASPSPQGLCPCEGWLLWASMARSPSSSNDTDYPFWAQFAKQRPDDVKERLICCISRASTPPRTHRPSLWTHTKGREPSGARGGAEMAVILSVENDDPNRFQLNWKGAPVAFVVVHSGNHSTPGHVDCIGLSLWSMRSG